MAETFQFYPIDFTYKIIQDKPVVFMYGVTPSGDQIGVLDRDFAPYFWVIAKDLQEVESRLRKIEVEKEKGIAKVTLTKQVKKKWMGDEITAIQVFTKHPKDVPLIKDVIKNWDIIESVHEYDILFVRRYLIDKKITPGTLVEVQAKPAELRSRVPLFYANTIEQVSEDGYKEPRALGIDIETYNPDGLTMNPEANPILMVALSGAGIDKVITWKKFPTNHKEIEFVASENDLLVRTIELIKEAKPDFLVGYFSDGFDLPYILTRAKKYKIPTELGHDFSDMKQSSRGEKTVQIEGIPHIDIYKFIKRIFAQELELESYKLGDVATELLGDQKVDIDISKLSAAWDATDPILDEYAIYNLQDAKLATQLFDKTYPNLFEMVKMVGIPFFDINRMAYSQLVEWFILRQASVHNEIAPNKPGGEEIRKRRGESYVGAFVLQPRPGFYKDIMVYDFKSLYPTIITSHNIGPSTLKHGEPGPSVKLENGEELWFSKNKKGFVPTIIGDIINRRKRIKEILKEKKSPMLEARQNSLKLLANSFYGYLGFAMARWYSNDCATATTAFGRDYIKSTIDTVNEAGFKAIYSDTDSVFFTLEEKSKEEATQLLEAVNADLPGMMELEVEGFYPKGIFVGMKDSTQGAKKKYALLKENNTMKIKGFETVRRNWSPIAKEVQVKVLEILLEDEDPAKAVTYVRNIIAELRAHSIEKEKVIITTQLTKDVESYENVGPHVHIAKQMQARNIPVGPGTMIKYIITKGSGLLRDRARLIQDTKPDEYDADYYISNQVVPAVDKILEVFNYTKEDLLESKSQSKLDSFFGS